MRLSEAMMLGSTMCKMEEGNWDSCALGSAANAIGLEKKHNTDERIDEIYSAWPWLRGGQISGIWVRFDHCVVPGLMTLEQLVDYVRSIEPSCGECNRFECTCVKTEQHQTDSVQLMDK